MDSNESKFQALRLQRFYLAQLSYAITYVVIGAAWLAGQYNASGAMAASHVLLGFSLQAVLFGILKSGLNLRFKDPSLTSLQMVIAMLLLTYLLAFSGEFRGSLIMIYPIILLFGVFQLSRRAFLTHAGLALILYGTLILFNTFQDDSTQALTVHLLEWFVLACFTGWLSFFCSYIRELRSRLQRRHNVLQTHQTTLRDMMGQLQSLADTDGLTGLANRRYFLSEARRRITLLTPGRKVGIALIDLDHFKKINDIHGHAAGDEVLKGFAEVARQNLREEDMVARFGGEEFVVMLDNSDLAALHQCIERIRTCFAGTCYNVAGAEVYCTLSAGLNLVRPDDNLEKRLNQADEALYCAKDNGRNRCEVYEEAYA
ncbi:GGDEF domain-containing protein [Halopseudomonas salina]|uniref:diguanylate cyclase n=1 Tax=Halopseudomonas salina TaxID=1323744 RepID=A0ABQ1PJR4_9GAMM|nr:GGDEF domain-containing protein [Halopseudomonas salina]GGC98502.1 hypothetical protein GCM10007418_17300 [Halopseudomonas salina]